MNQPILPIDYTNLGYDALRQAMLTLARESLPEWTDFSEQDLGVLLIELFAYANDITLYYQTRIAGNLFPATSDEPDALVQLLRLIGYELRPPAPATANLRLAFDAPLTVPVITIQPSTKFYVALSSGKRLTFETERFVQISANQLTAPDSLNLQYTQPDITPILVVQGETVSDEDVAVANGSPNQFYTLQQVPVIAGSVQITVAEPGGDTFWQEVDSLANSGPADRAFSIQRDAQGVATVVFGDGKNGLIPPRGTTAAPVKIKATYRVGGGPEGNVPALTRFDATPLEAPNPSIVAATNLAAAAGGTSAEDIDRARSFAPRLFRTQERAVTLQDYIDLALQVPGVGKALAVPLNWNQVQLYIAPTGNVTDPSESLQRDILAFFEGRRMATTALEIKGPQPADIYLIATVRAQPYYLKADVQSAVEQAVADYLAFDAVDFGQPIYLSKIYDVIQNLPQVIFLTVHKFSRNPDLNLQPDIETDGTIELAPYELPRPGYRDNIDTINSLNLPTPTPILLTIQGGVGR